MDARKTREPVSDHPIPSPATLPQQQSTQAINEALDEVLLSTPPKHQPPSQSAPGSENDEVTDMSTDTAQSETNEVTPPHTHIQRYQPGGTISVMVGVTVVVIGGGGAVVVIEGAVSEMVGVVVVVIGGVVTVTVGVVVVVVGGGGRTHLRGCCITPPTHCISYLLLNAFTNRPISMAAG
ncbi:hypothetical protein EV426DRAFT_583067 [Tirmania nivea]|nr:hypothetical protein EV426DRAFT_583067 [Tirmania nivea]